MDHVYHISWMENIFQHSAIYSRHQEQLHTFVEPSTQNWGGGICKIMGAPTIELDQIGLSLI